MCLNSDLPLKFNIWKFVAGLNPKYVLVFLVIFLPLSVYFTLQLKFSYDYEDFFPKGDPDLDFYYTFRDQFYKNGDKYEVMWKDNKRHGQGTYWKSIGGKLK